MFNLNFKTAILIWDIDGTLLTTNGSGIPAFVAAINKVANTNLKSFKKSRFVGRTDYEITEALLEEEGYKDISDVIFEEILTEYAQNLKNILNNKNTFQIDGVGSKIEYLKSYFPEIKHYIGTGNFPHCAEIKLQASGLSSYFDPNDIYCSIDSGPRRGIISSAKRSAMKYSSNIVVIGDTIHDEEAAIANNLPCLILESNYFKSSASNVKSNLIKAGWSLRELIVRLNGLFT